MINRISLGRDSSVRSSRGMTRVMCFFCANGQACGAVGGDLDQNLLVLLQVVDMPYTVGKD